MPELVLGGAIESQVSEILYQLGWQPISADLGLEFSLITRSQWARLLQSSSLQRIPYLRKQLRLSIKKPTELCCVLPGGLGLSGLPSCIPGVECAPGTLNGRDKRAPDTNSLLGVREQRIDGISLTLPSRLRCGDGLS
ncbi:MAG: hypothetical protein JOZ87_00845 [Chloroflexi bacterium]|nr:hypothetical protein [Chloroflexota bacterium]